MLRIWRQARLRTGRALVAGVVVLLSGAVMLVYFAPWDSSSDAAAIDDAEGATVARAESLAVSSGVAVEPGVPRRGPASALAGGGPEMGLTLVDGGFCAADECYAAVSSTFTLAVEALGAPTAKYVLLQTFIDYGVYNPAANEDGAGPDSCGDGIENGLLDGADRMDDDCVTVELVYVPAAEPEDEIVWEDLHPGSAVRDEAGPAFLMHGGVTNLTPPLLESDEVGVMVQVQMTCPAAGTSVPISLLVYEDALAGTNGSAFVEPDGQTKAVPKVAPITMNCVAKQADPGDTDGDGCSDVTENGSDPALGGNRDWLNPWDFYDVAGPGGVPVPDGIIDLANDIMGVINHAGAAPGPPYDVQYDRGRATGPSWNDTAPPDGVIDFANDILGVIGQFNHSCA